MLSSPRFAASRADLCQAVQKPEFSGWWICKEPEPAKADVTILFLHGGGYVFAHVALWTSMLLRIGDTIKASGLKVNLFALDYSFAPEYPFPKQVEQATAAYSYLLKDLGIHSNKVSILGDSAGGHLSLSFLAHLRSPIFPTDLPKPGGPLVLVAPWVSFAHSSTTFKRNAPTDNIGKPALDAWAKMFTETSTVPAAKREQYIEFAHPVAGRAPWPEILPKKVHVTCGDAEMLFMDIVSFADTLKESGVDVWLAVEKGKPHDYQMGDSALQEDAFLKVPPGEKVPDDVMPAARELGMAIVNAVKGS